MQIFKKTVTRGLLLISDPYVALFLIKLEETEGVFPYPGPKSLDPKDFGLGLLCIFGFLPFQRNYKAASCQRTMVRRAYSNVTCYASPFDVICSSH